jgi:hypothetical protein
MTCPVNNTWTTYSNEQLVSQIHNIRSGLSIQEQGLSWTIRNQLNILKGLEEINLQLIGENKSLEGRMKHLFSDGIDLPQEVKTKKESLHKQVQARLVDMKQEGASQRDLLERINSQISFFNENNFLLDEANQVLQKAVVDAEAREERMNRLYGRITANQPVNASRIDHTTKSFFSGVRDDISKIFSFVGCVTLLALIFRR